MAAKKTNHHVTTTNCKVVVALVTRLIARKAINKLLVKRFYCKMLSNLAITLQNRL